MAKRPAFVSVAPLAVWRSWGFVAAVRLASYSSRLKARAPPLASGFWHLAPLAWLRLSWATKPTSSTNERGCQPCTARSWLFDAPRWSPDHGAHSTRSWLFDAPWLEARSQRQQ